LRHGVGARGPQGGAARGVRRLCGGARPTGMTPAGGRRASAAAATAFALDPEEWEVPEMTWRNDLSRRDFHSLMAAFAAYAGTSLAGVGAAVAEAAAGKGGELVLGMSYTPPSLNPVVQSGFGAGQPGTQLFASPLRYDEGW